MHIRIKKLHSDAMIPAYQTAEAAGFDLHAIEDAILGVGERRLIGTGMAFGIDAGYEVQIRPRSGLALKHGITVLNTPGTIDSDYRGEIKVLLVNFGDDPFVIKKGERIAQAVIKEVIQASFELVETLDETQRGTGGFGSTGK